MRYVASLLGMVGLSWEFKQIRIDGQQTRIYKLSTEKLADLDYREIQKCITRKWEKYFSDTVKKPEWSSVIEPISSSSKPTNTPSPSKTPLTSAVHRDLRTNKIPGRLK